jgi:hypothetical protein
VIVRSYFPPKDRRVYFVDGRRRPKLLTHFLPIVEHFPCCHTVPVEYAAVDLRLIHDGSPKTGVRVIGRVYSDTYDYGHPVPGVRLFVMGPGGMKTVMTDSQGIYDLTGLPAGHYSVQLALTQRCRHFCGAEADVKSGEIWGVNLYDP